MINFKIKGGKVANEAKIYSFYEQHTDIIVKGSREIQFGHKGDWCSGKSNLILNCQVLRGNPSDKDLLVPALDAVVENYGKVPRDYATDGGYATLSNQAHALRKGISNIMFNKIVGSLKNIASSKNMETRLNGPKMTGFMDKLYLTGNSPIIKQARLLVVYPNPFNDVLQVENAEKVIKVELFNISLESSL